MNGVRPWLAIPLRLERSVTANNSAVVAVLLLVIGAKLLGDGISIV